MDEASSLSSATSRLERRDGTLTSIDIRGAFGSRARRSTARRFVAALKHCRQRRNHHPQEARCRGHHHHHHVVAPPPPSSSAIIPTIDDPPASWTRPWCSLRSVSLHNRLLEKSELPHLFGALPHVPTLEVLVLFNHDVGDDGAIMLMGYLTGSGASKKIVDGMIDGGSGRDGDAPPARAFNDMSMTTSTTKTTTRISMPHPKSRGLRELYLSHCGIGCRGARAIAAALDDSFACDDGDDDDNNRLKCLQVLSLGSNLIEWEGATPLAIVFGRYPPLQRLVLNGNRGIAYSRYPRMGHPIIANKHQRGERHRRERSMIRRAFVTAGWGCLRPPSSIPSDEDSDATVAKTTTPVSERAMSEIFVPLVLRYVTRRWEEDRVLIRPHDVLRARLREATMTRVGAGGGYAEYVDEHADCVPDVLSYLGRVGACCTQTSLHSSSCSVDWDPRGSRLGKTIVSHSTGWEICPACSAVHLGDLYDLFRHIPHIVATLRDAARLRIEGKGKS